ncbi:hypothetical protein FIBSPDRAFT_949594 [Athelia psychrophila]|uniref:Uncharacterized protein n=1 Tax=Athelia psychrophila TaxID=1759441 RepID=A0A166PHZ6_9AGAM|nr:hypothetical protein FIBSPDRAFT_949594 [Fibularhizoctonia sp. CBS 109695]
MSRSPPSSSTPATVSQPQPQVLSPMPAPRSPPHSLPQQPQPQPSPQQPPPAQHQPHPAPTHSNSQLAKLLSDSYREIDVLRRELHDAARRAERAEKILAAVSPSLALSPNANADPSANPNANATLPDATVRTIMDFEKRATDAEEARDKAEAGKRAIADHWAGFLARRLDREREDRDDTGAMARVVEQGGGVLVPLSALGYSNSFSVLGAREGTAFPTLNTPLHYGREMPPPALARYGSSSTGAATPRGRDPRPHTAATWPIPSHSSHNSFALSPQTQNLAGRGERVDRGERESVTGMRRPRAGSMDESGAYLGPPPKRARNDRGFDSYPSRDRLPPQPTQPTHPAPGQGHVRGHSYTQPPPQYAQSHHIAHGHRARSFSRSVSPNDRERERDSDMRDTRDRDPRGGRERERERDRRDDRDRERERERGSPHSDDIEGLLLDAATDRSPAHHHQSQSQSQAAHHASSRNQQHQQQQSQSQSQSQNQNQNQGQAQHHHQQGQGQHHQGIILSAPPAGATASAAAASVGPLAQPGLVTTYQTHIFAPPVTGAPTKKASLPLPGAHAHAAHGAMPLSSANANAGNSPGQPAAAVGRGGGGRGAGGRGVPAAECRGAADMQAVWAAGPVQGRQVR